MPSIRLEFTVDAPPAAVWTAVRRVDSVHTDLAPGFVTDCVMRDDERLITFANGLVARELIVDVDDTARRLAYSARSERLAHHHASLQVFEYGGRGSRVVWIADVMPPEAEGLVRAMMEQGVAVMKRTLECRAPGRE